MSDEKERLEVRMDNHIETLLDDVRWLRGQLEKRDSHWMEVAQQTTASMARLVEYNAQLRAAMGDLFQRVTENWTLDADVKEYFTKLIRGDVQ